MLFPFSFLWPTRYLPQVLASVSQFVLLFFWVMLKFHYFGHLMQKANSLEKTLMMGKIEGRRRSRWHRMRWLDGITDAMDMSLSKLQEIVKNRKCWHAAVHVVTESDMTEWLNNSFWNWLTSFFYIVPYSASQRS